MARTVTKFTGDEHLYPAEEAKKLYQARSASILDVILGAWLIIAPGILDFSDYAIAGTSALIGVIVAIAGLVRAIAPSRAMWLSWINILAGLWLVVASFTVVNAHAGAFWNSLISGALVVGLSSWSAVETGQVLQHHRRTYHV